MPCSISKWRTIAAVAVTVAVGVGLAPPALGQAGSMGGSIGKQSKSVSGDEKSAAPTARPAARPKREKRAALGEVHRRQARVGLSLTGRWSWNAQCDRFSEPYTGIVTITQHGNTFDAVHGGTNTYDRGTISNGRIEGRRVRM